MRSVVYFSARLPHLQVQTEMLNRLQSQIHAASFAGILRGPAFGQSSLAADKPGWEPTETKCAEQQQLSEAGRPPLARADLASLRRAATPSQLMA